MIRAKDLESMAESLNHLGLPFNEFITRQEIDYSAKEFNFNILDASLTENAVYRFCFKKENNGEYVIEDYQAKMLIVPIEHGHHAGIDTLELENLMKEIKWALFPIYKRDALLGLFEKLDQLRHSGDLTAKKIGDKLAIKYFSNTPLEEMLPLPDKRPYEKTIIIPIHNKGNDVDIGQAVQLLQGGTLLKYLDTNNESGELCWLKEDKGYLKIYSDFNVAEVVKQMPLLKQPDIVELSEILTDLGNGKPYATSLLINSRIVGGKIHVDPGNQSLEFRDNSGKTVNWKLWTKLKQDKKPGKGKKGPGL